MAYGMVIDMEFMKNEMNDLLDAIKAEYTKVRKERDDLINRMRQWNKDDEIQKAVDDYKDIQRRSLLVLTEKELKAKDDFISKHWAKHNGAEGKYAGNTYIYELGNTSGFGTSIKIACPICKESRDLTDYKSW